MASIGQAIATTGTGMTFWGLGIGAPKIMPKARDARIPKGKVDNYALNPNNPNGGANKARVVKAALDLVRSHSEWVENQLLGKVARCPAEFGKLDQYGQRYTVRIPVVGPRGRVVDVTTGWIIRPGDKTPTLTTLMIKGKGK